MSNDNDDILRELDSLKEIIRSNPSLAKNVAVKERLRKATKEISELESINERFPGYDDVAGVICIGHCGSHCTGHKSANRREEKK